ncbi:type I restriction enzyme, S subunit [Vibrio crassostreae]|nr:type I restriction enzyme, S subunit [Vibrio crassostreae]CAK2222815.1 type I restriction enzyme, S subunit [Vibrio crassostreae]CAK2223033.1 type I restriction enzyme, S subunit [Vibrio crassostreae]CAK2225095.1 type I restriction enzyme, S subunit [Vibrio crassostreae]CAK2235944.1 type I restriction enzyme, S subunit [Vibrio crassostreae]
MSQVTSQVVPDGYKQTEVGVIPDDWTVSTLNSLTMKKRPISYGIVQTGRKINGGIPCLRVLDIVDGKINSENLIFTTQRISDSYKRTQLIENDLVMPLRGKVGEVGLISKELVGANLTRGVALIALEKEYVPQYVKQALCSESAKNRLLNSMNGSALQEISIGTLRSFKLVIPQSSKEQTAIANALSDVDALLNELDKLIAKKQEIKTATMQQLLTGKARLPQFSTHTDGDKQGQTKGTQPSELGEIPEDWDVYVINDVTESLSSGGTPFRGNKSFYKGTNLWITSGELKYGRITDTIEKINNEAIKASHLKVHPEGTFLMAITGLEAAGTRGSCGIVGKPATTNQSCMAIYPNKQLTSEFLFHWYVYNGDELALKYCQGTKQLSYTAGLLKTLPILLPKNPEEQTAIATILSDMDEEIQALKQRLSKTRQIKQGMMQELLTGTTRLIQGEAHD